MRIIDLDQIKDTLQGLDILPDIEAGFVAYSQGKCVVPPVGELLFKDPPGDVHIKYGYITGGEYYVIKIASGFYDNPKAGLPTSDGMMLLFSLNTGIPQGLLLDHCYLTDVRTGAAGAIAAKYLAPRNVQRIGIVGAGAQARQQLRHLKGITPCREVIAWGLNQDELERYRAEMEAEGFHVETTLETAALADTCNLIVTVTPSTGPLLFADQIRPGTHITAVGADTTEKQELDPAILAKADLLVVDSVAQCLVRGECPHALRAGLIGQEKMVELGKVIAGEAPGRVSDEQITVCDLTGVAVQDLQIAKAVYEAEIRE